MAIFSPIAERSLRVRMLYLGIYVLLILGGTTMIIPFLIMMTGSVEPRSDASTSALFPKYWVDEDAMWLRYLDAKYMATQDIIRMAWGDPDANTNNQSMDVPHNGGHLELWNEFIASQKIAPIMYSIGFIRRGSRMPSYYGREFQQWLLKKYGGTLEAINEAFDAQYVKITQISVPSITMISAPFIQDGVVRDFFEFSEGVPWDRRFVWDAGGYYRGVYLPRILGPDVAAYNKKYGTSYKSYVEVPFPATVPDIGAEDWSYFVTRILRRDFVTLTGEGEAAQAESGVDYNEFLKTLAQARHLRVISLDRKFAAFAAERGVEDARIPQAMIDLQTFRVEKGFWKRQFMTMNYKRVIDEILLHGRAIQNTLILVVLCVGGALIVNPLAAYALSRFKLRTTYHILLFCLATISFPAEVTMIPVFLQLKEFNLLNTFGALVLPGLANGFSIFLLKGFFDSLPKELFEAAEIDGASEWTMFWNITMSLSKPILAVIALGAFVSAYSTFFYALILAPDPSMWTIMVYIYQLRLSVDAPVVYASLILTAIPTLLFFIFCQNIILRGIVVPSDK